jgi:sec-independent protein translocase protein TatA
MLTIGAPEMVVIFLLALILFGPKKLPELGRTIGKAITEFRRASTDLKASFEREMQNLERETQELKETTHSLAKELPGSSTYEYYPYNDYGEYVGDSSTTPATNPSTVSASEVPGAESHGKLLEAAPEHAANMEHAAEKPVGVEGTVPRTETESAPQHT